MLRLPRKSSSRESKCSACHGKVAPDAQSVAPATQVQPGPTGDQARATIFQRVKVLRLPRRSSSRRTCVRVCEIRCEMRFV